MKRMFIVFSFLSLVSIAAFFFIHTASSLHESVQTPEKQIPDIENPIPIPKLTFGYRILEVPPNQMQKVLNESYRLQPDKRFVLSVAQIHKFLTNEPMELLSVMFDQNSWLIQYKNQDVGKLPDISDFSHAMDLLSDWTKKIAIQKGSVRIKNNNKPIQDLLDLSSQFYAPQQIVLLQKANKLWLEGNKDSYLLAASTKALVNLNLQGLDEVELGDAVAARAVTLLVLTKTLTKEETTREECLLSKIMGYSTHASNVCKLLPETEPSRLFGTNQDKVLESAALSESASAETRYLWLRRLASLKNEERWSEYLKKAYPKFEQPLSIISTGLTLDDFGTSRVWTQITPALLVQQVSNEESNSILFTLKSQIPKELLTEKISILTDRFEKILDEKSARFRGPFLNSQDYSSFYRDYFYSALHIQGLFYMDSLSSVGAVADFADELNQIQTKGYGRDFASWYAHLAKSKQGNRDLQPLLDDFQALPNYGARILFRTMERIIPRIGDTDPKLFTAIKKLAMRMDTRPRHRSFFVDITRDQLMDLKQMEVLCESILRDDRLDESKTAVWCAQYTGKPNLLIEHLNSPQFEVSEKGRILRFLRFRNDVDINSVNTEFERAIEAFPDDWDIREEYVEFLRKQDRNPETISLIEDWLKSHNDSYGFDYLFAKKALAQSYYLEAQYEAGWKVIEPVIDSYQGGVLEKAFFLLYKLGREKESMDLIEKALDRYPDDTDLLIDKAEVLWRLGRNNEAAESFQSFSHPITDTEWCYSVAERFAQVFSELPKEQALEAADALISNKATAMFFRCVGESLAKFNKYDVASEIIVKANEHGLGDMGMFVNNYKYLKAAKGKEEALSWAKSVPIQQKYSDLSLIMFDYGEYDLLWELITDPEQAPQPKIIWLMRATSSVQMGTSKDPYFDKLRIHYETPSDDFYDHLGRYLLGFENEKEILDAAADNPKQRGFAAFMIGLKNQAKGNYDDSMDWYRISLEIGQNIIGNYPMRWSSGVLDEWIKKRKTLPQIAAEKQTDLQPTQTD